ncbi:MAG: hypothetical protein ACRERD_18440, partial [Candidatus Binatia bacterium]
FVTAGVALFNALSGLAFAVVLLANVFTREHPCWDRHVADLAVCESLAAELKKAQCYDLALDRYADCVDHGKTGSRVRSKD